MKNAQIRTGNSNRYLCIIYLKMIAKYRKRCYTKDIKRGAKICVDAQKGTLLQNLKAWQTC